MNTPRIAFFGTPDIAVYVLEELKTAGIVPTLIVTNPDRPQGRKMIMTPPPVKDWADEKNIEVMQPESFLNKGQILQLTAVSWDLFIVVAYGKILPKEILDIPKHGTLNVHPSLLPKLRGASPIRSAILADERETGITIMLMDEKMDHGPIVAQHTIGIAKENWPIKGKELDESLARLGGSILANTIPEWIAGHIKAQEQDHERATFCKKIAKADGEIDLNDNGYQNYLKFCAYDGWPGTFFFKEEGSGPNAKKTRIKITDARLSENGSFEPLLVVPEGKKEVIYTSYIKNKPNH